MIEEGSLTGEREPKSKSAEIDGAANFATSQKVCLSGTTCTSGSGYGVVVATGPNTIQGQIATLTD